MTVAIIIVLLFIDIDDDDDDDDVFCEIYMKGRVTRACVCV
jgi:hypothetical protein